MCSRRGNNISAFLWSRTACRRCMITKFFSRWLCLSTINILSKVKNNRIFFWVPAVNKRFCHASEASCSTKTTLKYRNMLNKMQIIFVATWNCFFMRFVYVMPPNILKDLNKIYSLAWTQLWSEGTWKVLQILYLAGTGCPERKWILPFKRKRAERKNFKTSEMKNRPWCMYFFRTGQYTTRVEEREVYAYNAALLTGGHKFERRKLKNRALSWLMAIFSSKWTAFCVLQIFKQR